MTAWTMTFDGADPAVLAAFWRTAFGYVDAHAHAHAVMADPEGNEFCVV